MVVGALRARRMGVNETDWAYLAGIIDGEGYIGPNISNLGIRVVVADEPLIDWLHERFGGTRGSYANSGSENMAYYWQAQRQDLVLDIIGRVMPYLVIKRGQAEAMVDLIYHMKSRPRQKSLSHISSAKRQPYKDEYQIIRALWSERAERLRQAVRDARLKPVPAVRQ